MNLDSVPLVQAKNFTPGRKSPVTLIVIHDMEAGENTNTAENCAAFFAGANAPQASAHYNCDNDSIVCSVRPEDTAWHTAERRTNSCGIGIEQAGYAAQTKDDWADPYSHSMIFGQVAPLVKALSDRYSIPLVEITADDMKAGNFSGVTTHAAISEAFVPGGHTDPGPNYPLTEMIAAAAGPQQEDDMTPEQAAQLTDIQNWIKGANGQKGISQKIDDVASCVYKPGVPLLIDLELDTNAWSKAKGGQVDAQAIVAAIKGLGDDVAHEVLVGLGNALPKS
jgi:N-acetyl-anhydromuramyl-L-alanine amidase AmpD